MITQPVTEELVQEMRSVWNKWHDTLRPDRKSGAELIVWLQKNYPVTEFFEEEALACVRENVLQNDFSREKLPDRMLPHPRAFHVENTGTGADLYTPELAEYGIEQIFVGIDEVTGEFHIEMSETLWDAMFAFRGLDEKDLKNPYLVWQYLKIKEAHNHDDTKS